MLFKKRVSLALIALLGVAGSAVAEKNIVVGGKNFTEQQVIADITSQYLTDNGFSVDKRTGMGSTVLRKAQKNGQVDLYWEYTGTALVTFNKFKKRLPADETYAKVKALDAKQDLVWLNPSAANNTYALAMRRSEADSKNIHSLSELAAAINKGDALTLAANAEFPARPDGLRPLQKTYGFAFPRRDIKRMDSGLTYQALREGRVDVALVFATDGRVPAFDFVILKDDKHFFPSYAMTPVVRAQTLEAYPELKPLLNTLSAKLDDSVVADMNARVDVERKTIEAVAHDFLVCNSLIKREGDDQSVNCSGLVKAGV